MHVALRLCLAAVICSIGMSAAAAQTCTYPGQDYYDQASSASCNFASYCFNDLCTCLGLASSYWNQTLNGQKCLTQTTPTCRTRGQCLGKLFKCLILAGENHRTTTGCTTFGSAIHMGYLQYASSPNYTATTLFTSCVYSTCKYNGNATTNPSTCTISAEQICVCSSPEGTTPTITITGTFPTTNSQDVYWTAIEKDLLALFSGPICITSLTASTTSIVIVLAVHNGAPQSKVNTAATTTTWLTNLKALAGVTVSGSSGSNLPTTTLAPTTTPVTTAGATAGAFSFLALLALAMLL